MESGPVMTKAGERRRLGLPECSVSHTLGRRSRILRIRDPGKILMTAEVRTVITINIFADTFHQAVFIALLALPDVFAQPIDEIGI